MSLEGRGSEGMFLRILAHRQEQRDKKKRKECPKCNREIAVFKSGKFYNHNCEKAT